MRVFYCPNCGRFEIKKDMDGNPYEKEKTIKNMLQWDVIPIQHYKCECGNYLAGYLHFYTEDGIISDYKTDESYNDFEKLGDKQQEDLKLAFQDMIAAFNKGGFLYRNKIVSENHNFENLDDFAKWSYENRLEKEKKGMLDKNIVFNPNSIKSLYEDISM